MSLLNVTLLADRAFVAVDTASVRTDTGATFEASKMLHVPPAGLIFAGRGLYSLMQVLAGSWITSQRDFDFDTVSEDGTRGVQSIFDAWVGEAEQSGRDVSPLASLRHEIVVVGWSRSEQKMAGLVLECGEGERSFKARRIDGGHYSEMDEDLTGVTVPDHCAYMVAIAEAQMRFIRRNHPAAAAYTGGRLLVADLTRTGCCIHKAADL